ncbi:group I intron-associated PD-(D/E)XK endonuclease [Halorubrum distributum]|uniref:group I intron-associated PD-(D/E)XK endonuclease n=1 Tax=Halorubrum distributum TaxID=29283 RepID=UPI00295302F4|nr:group I intron-associated PD-(D/E)XK endonuclease [Halorubrum distributum]MDV7349958.1 group I intron-associated PD-(D/E)XK endonuclease [Halorubrum distributum]
MESHRRGDLTEQIVITELKRQDISVSTPVGDNERYDVVIEQPEGGLLRAQVKTGRLKDGTIRFSGLSQHTNASGHTYERYGEDIDCFAVYCYDTDQTYLIPAAEVGTSMYLRVDAPDKETRQVNWAEKYRLEEQWPIDENDNSDTIDSTVIETLRQEDVSVYRNPEDEDQRTVLVEDTTGDVSKVGIQRAWQVENRIRCTLHAEADYYLIYCESLDQTFSVHAAEFGESVSLRIKEGCENPSRTKLADDYAFEDNWPPVVDPSGTSTSGPLVSRTVEMVESDRYTSTVSTDCDDWRTVIANEENSEFHLRVESAWLEDGLLRFNVTEPADFYVIEHPEEVETYLIPDDAFNKSISLRVEPPKKSSPRINYAEDFRFEERWPPQ